MVATQQFNQQQQTLIPQIYGAVTSRTNWRFLTLHDQMMCIDKIEYYISNIDRILGIIVSPFSALLNSSSVATPA